MKKISQALSVILSAVLAIASTPWNAMAIGPIDMPAPAFVNAFTPAENLGYVASSYSPDANAKHPRLVIVSDLHGHVEVQRNIMGILDKVVNKLRGDGANKKIPVFVEGGWTSNLEEPLRLVNNGNVRTFLREYFLQKAELSAAQAYSEQVAGSGKVTLIGVEDEKEYKTNKSEFAKTYEARRHLLQALQLQEQTLLKLSGAISNDSFESLRQARQDYNSGRISSEAYAKLLVHKALRHKVAGPYLDTLRNVSTASSNDLELAFEETYRAVATAVAPKAPMASMLTPTLGNERALRVQVARSDADLDLLKRLISNQLTPAEVPLALNRMPALIQLAKALLGDEGRKLDVENVVRQSIDFYPYALMRDESLVKNSLANLDHMGADATGILIVGGFHSQAIADYLRMHHVSYMEINPTITRDETAQEELNYVKRVCDQHVTPSELENDVKWLRGEKRRQEATGSAGAAVADLDQGKKTPGDVSQFVLGLSPSAMASLASEGTVLAETLTHAAQARGEVLPVEEAAATAQRAKAIQSKIAAAAEKAPSLKNLKFEGLPSLTLRRDSNGNWTRNGDASPYWAELANSIVDEETNQGVDTLHFQMLNNSDRDTLGGEGAVFGDKSTEKELVVGLIENRFRPIDALGTKVKPNSKQETMAFRAIHIFAHEVRAHALNRNSDEVQAIKEGVAAGAIMAVGHFSQVQGSGSTLAIVRRFLKAISPQVRDGMDGWDTTSPGLAERIANIIDSGERRDQKIQRIVGLLTKEYPDLPEAVIKLQAQQEMSDLVSRATGGESEGPFLANMRRVLGNLRTGMSAAKRFA